MNQLIQNTKSTTLLLVTFVLVCLTLSPSARAQRAICSTFTTGEGCQTLKSLTTGTGNTAFGWRVLFTDTDGSFNTGVGAGALVLNTASSNTAVGAVALLLNTTGSPNTAVGTSALLSNDSGSFNTAVGNQALSSNVSGLDNTAMGDGALTASTGNDNTALGFQAGSLATTGDGNVYIGSGMSGVAGESNQTYIRNVNTTTVSGVNADLVSVDLTTGLLGHATSSRRYKEDINPMDKSSELLFELKPVTFRYKKEIDHSQSLEYGLVAEEVAQVDPNLAIRNRDGQIDSVRYSAINAMLLNEFLKEHKAFVEEQHKVQTLEANAARQQKQIEALTAGLQKVSAQLELNKPAPQTALNSQ